MTPDRTSSLHKKEGTASDGGTKYGMIMFRTSACWLHTVLPVWVMGGCDAFSPLFVLFSLLSGFI